MNQNKLERLERIQTINFELMDAYRSGLSWMVDYCEKNNLPYPDLNRAYYLIHVSGMMLEQPDFNNHSEHPKKTQNLIFIQNLIHISAFFNLLKNRHD